MMIKVIWWTIKILAICLLVAVISNQEGNTEIVWVGWKMEIPTSILVGGLIILILLLALGFKAISPFLEDTIRIVRIIGAVYLMALGYLSFTSKQIKKLI